MDQWEDSIHAVDQSEHSRADTELRSRQQLVKGGVMLDQQRIQSQCSRDKHCILGEIWTKLETSKLNCLYLFISAIPPVSCSLKLQIKC